MTLRRRGIRSGDRSRDAESQEQGDILMSTPASIHTFLETRAYRYNVVPNATALAARVEDSARHGPG